MKKMKFLLVALVSATLVGCDLNLSLNFSQIINSNVVTSETTSIEDTSEEQTSSEGFNSETSTSENNTTSEEESSSENTTSIGQTSSENTTSSENVTTSEEDSSSTSSSSSEDVVYGDRKVNLYSINDFHGATEVISSNYEAGILKVGTFLKQKGQEDNTLLINAGDMWQGSVYSNYNYGKMLTDIMNDIQFDAFTIGNHEFDWGAKYIAENKLRKGPNGNDDNGYQTPFLGANIYKFDILTKTVKQFASDLAQKYVIRELENGLKVGIIGTIGVDQITSICSQYSDAYTFIDPIKVTKELSDELRNDHGCDVIVLSSHTDPGDVLNTSTDNVYSGALTDNNGLTSYSAVSGKRYVDAVICAHTHRGQTFTSNGVPLIQAQSNGKSYGYISLNVDSEGNITTEASNYTYTSKIPSMTTDSTINSIYTKFKNEASVVGDQILGTLDSTLSTSSTTNISNLVTEAIANYAISSGYDIDYAMTNGGRADLPSGSISYANLFKSLPFDNVVYIAKVNGYNLKYNLEKSYNYMYRIDTSAMSSSKTTYYTVAIIDYLLLHRNTDRDYNYFTYMEILGSLSKDGYEIYNYRDITADHIKSKGSIKASDYSSSNTRFDTSKLGSAVSF